MRIHYISYGISETGGYRHEMDLFRALANYRKKTVNVEAWQYRKGKLFTSLAGYAELLLWSFFKSNADINIVTARTGVPAMLRNMRNKKEVWVVLHNFDPEDGKSPLMEKYYRKLFSMLSKASHGRFKVIAVAPFWEKYFRENMHIPHTYLFPNLFDTAKYADYRNRIKNQWVHLGQFSSKNDPEIVRLAGMLTRDGYYCYFSTLIPEEARPGNGNFEIVYFNDFEEYLMQMSECCCTLALTRINEGWNRIAHESLLVGTPVIGYARGGLGDLLRESNSIIVKDIEEAYTCIKESLLVLPDTGFTKSHDISNAEQYIEAICKA